MLINFIEGHHFSIQIERSNEIGESCWGWVGLFDYYNIDPRMATKQNMIKSEIVAITYSAIVKQIFKLSKSNAESNRKLFDLGEEMGLRVADELTERETNSYKPDEVAGVFLKECDEGLHGLRDQHHQP